MRRFRTGELVAEQLRNLRARPWRTALVAVIAAGLGAGVVLTTLLNGDQIRQQWDAQVSAGRFIEVVRSASLEGFPSSYCEDLARIDGVEAAGGITGRRTVQLAELPGLDRELVTVTPGLARVAWPESTAPDTGYLAGPGLASDLGLLPGAELTVRGSGTELDIESVPTGKSRVDGINGALLELQPAGTSRMRECLVAYAPGAQGQIRALLDTATPELYPSQHAPLLQDNDLVQDPERLLQARPSSWGPAIAVAVFGLLAGVLWWGSRAELAIYRSLGARPRQIAIGYAAEVFWTAMVPLCLGASLALGWTVLHGGACVQSYELAASDLMITVLGLAPLPMLGVLLAGTLSPVAVFKGA